MKISGGREDWQIIWYFHLRPRKKVGFNIDSELSTDVLTVLAVTSRRKDVSRMLQLWIALQPRMEMPSGMRMQERRKSTTLWWKSSAWLHLKKTNYSSNLVHQQAVYAGWRCTIWIIYNALTAATLASSSEWGCIRFDAWELVDTKNGHWGWQCLTILWIM